MGSESPGKGRVNPGQELNEQLSGLDPEQGADIACICDWSSHD